LTPADYCLEMPPDILMMYLSAFKTVTAIIKKQLKNLMFSDLLYYNKKTYKSHKTVSYFQRNQTFTAAGDKYFGYFRRAGKNSPILILTVTFTNKRRVDIKLLHQKPISFWFYQYLLLCQFI
jgi:hypothetical protein